MYRHAGIFSASIIWKVPVFGVVCGSQLWLVAYYIGVVKHIRHFSYNDLDKICLQILILKGLHILITKGWMQFSQMCWFNLPFSCRRGFSSWLDNRVPLHLLPPPVGNTWCSFYSVYKRKENELNVTYRALKIKMIMGLQKYICEGLFGLKGLTSPL